MCRIRVNCLANPNGNDLQPNDDACMYTYPYWLMFPDGWDFPAACASGSNGSGGWAASVDLQKGMFLIFHF